jgi:hypothetical protein
MVLKLLAILPRGSAGKYFEKNLEFGKMGGYTTSTKTIK